MDKNLVGRQYTETDLQNAKTKGQVVGWVQGGLAMLAGLMVLRFVGWIPSLVVLVVVAVITVRLLSHRK